MVTSENSQELLNTLEDMLVKEFRVCQALYNLTRDERTALSANDVPNLLELVERKESTLDELSQLDDAKRMATQELGASLGITPSNGSPITLADVLQKLEPETSNRLGHLRSGILTLVANVREMTYGNHALAAAAKERADAVQAFLLNLYQPPTTYGPYSQSTQRSPSVSWEVDQAV